MRYVYRAQANNMAAITMTYITDESLHARYVDWTFLSF